MKRIHIRPGRSSKRNRKAYISFIYNNLLDDDTDSGYVCSIPQNRDWWPGQEDNSGSSASEPVHNNLLLKELAAFWVGTRPVRYAVRDSIRNTLSYSRSIRFSEPVRKIMIYSSSGRLIRKQVGKLNGILFDGRFGRGLYRIVTDSFSGVSEEHFYSLP